MIGIDADYLIVGAGAAVMPFLDALTLSVTLKS
jgi:hypothetical protein